MIAKERDGLERSVVLAGAETLLLKVLLYLAGFGIGVLISRALGPEGRGMYYLPLVAAASAVALCKLGLEQANVYLFGARGYSLERLCNQNNLVALTVGGLGAVALVQTPRVLPDVFSATPTVYLVLAAISVPFSLHTQFSAGLLTLQGKVTWQFRVGLLASVGQAVSLLTLALLSRLTVAWTLGISLGSAILTWGLTLLGFRSREVLRTRWDGDLLRETVSHSLMLHLGMVLFFMHLRVDVFMIQAMLGTAAVGYYSVSVALAETVLLASDSLAIALLPRQMGNALGDAALLALRGARMNLLLGLLLGLGWAAAGYWIITVFYGAEFAPAFLPLVGLLPGTVLLGMQRCAGGPVLRAGTPSRLVAIYAVSLMFNVAFNLWLIPAWGILGAAIASSGSYSLGALLFLRWTSRLAKVPLVAGLIPGRVDLESIKDASYDVVALLMRLATKRGLGV